MNPDNHVYDDKDSDYIPKPILNSLENGDPENEQKGKPGEGGLYNPDGDSKDKKSLNSDDLNQAESQDPSKSPLARGLYNANPELRIAEKVVSAIGVKRNGVIAGLLTFFIAGICAVMFMLATGPGQLVQLSQLLQKNFSAQQSATSSRGNALFRYATAADIGETRVGVLGRQFLRPAVQQLSDLGIKFNLTDTVGLKSVSIDTEKLASKYPELNGMSDEQKISWLSEHFSNGNFTLDSSQISGSGNNYTIDSSGMPLASDKEIVGSGLAELDNGAIDTTILNHVFSDYLGTSSIFHPITKLTQDKLKQMATKAGQEKQVQEEEDQITEPSDALGDAAAADVNSKNSTFGSPLSSALLIAGTACFAKGVAGDITTLNRDRVVLPAIAVALHFIAVGEQIKTGQDITAQQVGAEANSLTSSSGQTIWAARSLQASEGISNPSGPDIPSGYQQAFKGDNSTANALNTWGNAAFLGSGLLASVACSPVGQAAQVIGTIGISVSGLLDGGLSDVGLATIKTLALKEGESFIGSIAGMQLLKQVILNSSTEGKLAKTAFSGGLGGNLLAYGARAAGNMAAIASGGVKLAGSAASALSYQEEQQSRQQFQSESLFARVFSLDDYRSIFGKLADSISPSLSTNFVDGVASLTSLPHSLLSSFSSLFIPKSEAANPYNWNMPTYGIPGNLLSNPAYANPYENANIVADYLNSNCLNSDKTVNTSCGYDGVNGIGIIQRALYCWGAQINKDSTGVWDVTMAPTPADPASSNYQNSNCDNISDTTWARMLLFVTDTRTMQGIACYKGDSTSCVEAGDKENTVSTTSTTNSTCNSVPPANSNFFTVVGKVICQTNGKQYTPYGISVVDDLDQRDWCTQHNEAASDAQIQAAARYWNVNSIRLQVSEDNFVATAKCTSNGTTYTASDALARLKQEVDEIQQNNDIPIINDNTEFTGGSIAPTQRTIDFWNSITAYFSGQSGNNYNDVVFDIFNEPVTSGSVWQNGGNFNGSNYLGMQQVVNAIRSGSNLNNNLIFVEGEGGQGYSHSGSLAVLDNYQVNGSNLVYSYHHVNLNQPESSWEDTMGLKSGINAPIVDGEWTQYSSSRNFECYVSAPKEIPTYLSLMQQNGIGMIFWSLEPGVGTPIGNSPPHPVSDTIQNWFSTNPSDYSQPSTMDSSYSCSEDSSGNLRGMGAGSSVVNYFLQNSQQVSGVGSGA